MGGFFGGVAKSVGNILSAPATIASAIPVVGPIAGPAISIATGDYLGAARQIGLGAAMGSYGGGGGGGGGGGTPTPSGPTTAGGTGTTPYYSPTYNYGANSYTVDNNPFDTSKYFIQGNKGTYNLLPQLANLYDPATQQRAGAPSANIYGDILGQIRMNQDTLAEQNLQKNFGLQSYAPSAVTTSLPEDYSAPSYVREDIQNALGEFYPSGSTPSGVVPVSYTDFGFKPGDTLQNIASYAKRENNPFFMPYAPENVRPEPEPYRAPTIMPVPSMVTPTPEPTRYRPSEDVRGPAPRDLAPTSVSTGGSFRPIETASPTARTASSEAPAGGFKPVNIRTGGLASLRRKA